MYIRLARGDCCHGASRNLDPDPLPLPPCVRREPHHRSSTQDAGEAGEHPPTWTATPEKAVDSDGQLQQVFGNICVLQSSRLSLLVFVAIERTTALGLTSTCDHLLICIRTSLYIVFFLAGKTRTASSSLTFIFWFTSASSIPSSFISDSRATLMTVRNTGWCVRRRRQECVSLVLDPTLFVRECVSLILSPTM